MAPFSGEYNPSLSEEDWKYLKNNHKYTETDSERSKGIHELQKWLQENPHINANPNPRNLVRFLRHSSYRLDVCKKRIENFYLMRAKVTEWFTNRDINLPVLRDLIELGPILPLLKKDASKRTTIITRPTVHDPYKVSHNDRIKIDKMVFDLSMEKDETIDIYGVNLIVDLRNIRLAHIVTPGVMKRAVHAIQDCYPISVKSVVFIFAPKFVNLAIDLFKQFMSAKLRSRVHVYGKDLDSLHAIVPPEILPKEYGGTAGHLQELIDYWKEEVLTARDWFLEDEKYRTLLED